LVQFIKLNQSITRHNQMFKTKTLVIGTRQSQLALWQTNHIKQQLETHWPGLSCQLETFVTKGDQTLDKPLPQIGGKGLFTAELEAALHNGRIDLAVHSLKDLPVEETPGLVIGAISRRADVRDVLVAQNDHTLAALPAGAVVGTGSPRRKAQLLACRPDLVVRPVRGNVDTRIGKVMSGDYDAVVLAAAGIIRLGLEAAITDWLSLDTMLPAPGQGALAVQCRAGDEDTLKLLVALHDEATMACVTAERAFLSALGGGCSLPVGAYAEMSEGVIQLSGLVAAEDGRQVIRLSDRAKDPDQLGRLLAEQALAQGAEAMLP
jgi:hydroxymethylbilane synthase